MLVITACSRWFGAMNALIGSQIAIKRWQFILVHNVYLFRNVEKVIIMWKLSAEDDILGENVKGAKMSNSKMK